MDLKCRSVVMLLCVSGERLQWSDLHPVYVRPRCCCAAAYHAKQGRACIARHMGSAAMQSGGLHELQTPGRAHRVSGDHSTDASAGASAFTEQQPKERHPLEKDCVVCVSRSSQGPAAEMA